MKKEIPILMSTPMVLAELDGRKTMTRRTTGLDEINEDPDKWEFSHFVENPKGGLNAVFKVRAGHEFELGLQLSIRCPYGKPGDILWVREKWAPNYVRGCYEEFCVMYPNKRPFEYFADHPSRVHVNNGRSWKPSIHMPKVACRIWQVVTSIKIERLQDIREADAIAEGLATITKDGGTTWKYGIPDSDGLPGTDDVGWPWHEWDIDSRVAYFKLWKQINGPESVGLNPWVWVVSFTILSTTGKPVKK